MAVIGNSATQQAFTPAVDFFSGNASTTAFTLSKPVASVAQVQAVIENVPQNPGSAYTVSGSTITFTSAPPSGTNNIYVYYTSPITQLIAPSQGTVNTTQLGTITNIASGSSSLTLQTGASNTTAATFDTSQKLTLPNDATISGLTVGKGAGSISTNTAVGASALAANTSGNTNVAVGASALAANTTGAGTTAVGQGAMQINTTGNYNDAYGWIALYANTTGSSNSAFGNRSLTANTTGSNNIAVGAVALGANTTGGQNTAIGLQALQANTTTSNNTAVGYQAAFNVTGSNNTAVGYSALTSTISTNHVAIGRNANTVSTNGDRCTVIGALSNPSASSTDAEIVIGYAVTGQADSYITMGSNLGKIYNAYRSNATWTQTSDGRLKKNIKPDTLGLSFINRLNPVTFNWKPSYEIDPSLPYYNEVNGRDTETVIHGFIAQEVKEALDAEGCSTFNGWDAGNHEGIQAISREMFISPLVKAIQELKALVDAQATEIAELKAKVG